MSRRASTPPNPRPPRPSPDPRDTRRPPGPPGPPAPPRGGGQDGLLARLAEAERQWDGPIPEPALAVALAGSPERAQAGRRLARRRGLDRAADSLRRIVARRRQAIADAILCDSAPADSAPAGPTSAEAPRIGPMADGPARPMEVLGPSSPAAHAALDAAAADLAAFRHAVAEAMAGAGLADGAMANRAQPEARRR